MVTPKFTEFKINDKIYYMTEQRFNDIVMLNQRFNRGEWETDWQKVIEMIEKTVPVRYVIQQEEVA